MIGILVDFANLPPRPPGWGGEALNEDKNDSRWRADAGFKGPRAKGTQDGMWHSEKRAVVKRTARNGHAWRHGA